MNPIELLGTGLAITGSLISIIGTIENNVRLNHLRAMKVWAISNVLLLIWATGLSCGYWDGGLSGIALIAMYFTFTTTNAYGLWKKAKV